MQTLSEIKDTIAKLYGREDFQEVKNCFIYGIGIAKLMDEFEYMDLVVKEACRQACQAQQESCEEQYELAVDQGLTGTALNMAIINAPLPEIK